MFSSSPKLFAADRVFLRLPTPRHPPGALNNLSQKNFASCPVQLSIRSSRCPDPLRFETITASLRSDPLGGGDGRNRTDDPLRAKQVLSQLSYAPDTLVGLERLELSTSRLSGVRSDHLSYRPAYAAPCK